MAAKKTDYRIEKKRSGRYAVYGRGGKIVNGDDKVKILTAKGLVKAPTPKKKEAPADAAEAES